MKMVGETRFWSTFDHYDIVHFLYSILKAQQLYQKHINPLFFSTHYKLIGYGILTFVPFAFKKI